MVGALFLSQEEINPLFFRFLIHNKRIFLSMFIQAGIIEYIAFCYDFQKRNSKSSNPFFFFQIE